MYYFKVELHAEGLNLGLPDGENLTFKVDGQPHVTIIVHSMSARELREKYLNENPMSMNYPEQPPITVCTVIGVYQVPESLLAIYEMHFTGEFPSNVTEKDAIKSEIRNVPIGPLKYENGELIQNYQKSIVYSYPLEVFGNDYKEFTIGTFSKVLEFARRTIHMLRWRLGDFSNHDPVSSITYSTSPDGENWDDFSRNLEITTWVAPNIQITEDARHEVQKLLNISSSEPVAHGLLREAWTRRIDDPRSSIIVGVAAAETGIKQCIMTLVPDTRGLLEDIPSPPFKKLLNYVSILSRPDGRKIISPPNKGDSKITARIIDGIELRNKVVHLGYIPSANEQNHKLEALLSDLKAREELLLCVRDLLWILDYNCGYDWALEHLRPQTRALLES